MGVLYAKVDGYWEPIITALQGGGIDWPIQTRDPPLVIGATIEEQGNVKPDAFVQLDKYEMMPGLPYDPDNVDPVANESGKWYLPKSLQFHPMSEYGPFWTYNGTGATPAAPYLRDVNPYAEYGRISSDWTGALYIEPASGIWYTTTPGKNQLVKPEGGYVPYEQVWQYNMDARFNYDYLDIGFGGLEVEHWQDIVRGYTDEDGDPYWDAGIADLWLGSGAFFELFTDSFSYYPRNEVEVMSAIWGTAYAGDITSDPRRPEVVIWARWEEGRPDHEDDLQEDLAQREVHFTSHNMHLYAGPINRGLPDGQHNRGNIPVLAAAAGHMGKASAPQLMQWYRQVGISNVTFVDGVGSLVPPEETSNDGLWHAQATIYDADMGGPMIAQVLGTGGPPGSNGLLEFYLDRPYDGDLVVSWSIDYPEPIWSLTRPRVGYIYVYGEPGGGFFRPNNAYFLNDGVAILIPWADTGTVDLYLNGEGFNGTSVVKDLSGATIGTISELSFGPGGGQDSFLWTLPRDLYDVEDGTSCRVVNSDGQQSNWFELKWADIELPTSTPI